MAKTVSHGEDVDDAVQVEQQDAQVLEQELLSNQEIEEIIIDKIYYLKIKFFRSNKILLSIFKFFCFSKNQLYSIQGLFESVPKNSN